MQSKKNHILILDANQRSALAVTRSLGKINGINITCADSCISSLAGSSRFCNAYHQYPDLKSLPSKFMRWLELFVADHDIDVVIPCTEISCQTILMSPKIIGDKLYPLPDYETVMSLADKGSLIKFALNHHVNVPHTEFFSNGKSLNPSEITQYPIVVKPCLSHIYDGEKWTSTSVFVADSYESLVAIMNSTPHLNSHPFMIQEYIGGHGAGIFALYNNGNPEVFFSHTRVREKPPEGGVSTLSESAPLNEQLLSFSKTILGHAKWHGVAMVEFRIDENGTPYLMEVNTRFWGSLQLAIDSGVDFPELLWSIYNGQPAARSYKYKVGQRLRWVIGDIDSLYLTLRSKNFSISHKLAVVGSFLMPHPFTTRHEINRINDMGPFFYELRAYFKTLYKKR